MIWREKTKRTMKRSQKEPAERMRATRHSNAARKNKIETVTHLLLWHPLKCVPTSTFN